MPLNMRVNDPSVDRSVIVTSGIVTCEEHLIRRDNFLDSYVKITVSGLTLSGSVDHVAVSLREGNTLGCNYILFDDNPNAGEIITLDDRTYRFVTSLSGVDQVLITDSLLGTARNLFCTLTVSGLSGTDYYTGQTAHSTISAPYADNPLFLTSRIRGTFGNLIKASTTSSNLTIASTYFYGGNVASDVYPWAGEVSCTGDGSYDTIVVPYTSTGNYLEGTLHFISSGVDVVNVSGEVAYYSISGIFSGYTDMPDFVEVTNLSGIMSAGDIDSSGYFNIFWDNMNKVRGPRTLNYARPYASGAQTQSTLTLSDAALAQNMLYYIFVWLSDVNSSPECSWPRSVDSKGTWYYIGRTSRNSIGLTFPRNKYISIWVGFGNKHTVSTTRTPIGRTTNLIS